MRERAFDEEISFDVLRTNQRVDPSLVAPGAVPDLALWEVFDSTSAPHELRISPQEVELKLQSPRLGDVVGVHSSEEFASRLAPGRFERGHETQSALAYDGDAKVRSNPRIEEIASIVGRPVVDRDYLEVGKCLLRNGPDRVRKKAPPVPNRQQHGDER